MNVMVADIFSPDSALLNVFTALPMVMESEGVSKYQNSYDLKYPNFKSYDLSDLHNGRPSYETKRSAA